jgi:Outer membrane protein Omp28
MRCISLVLFSSLFLYSCNTKPPTSPEISYPTGKIIATTTIDLNQSSTSTDKVVLLEDFANVSCVPCVTSDQIIESLLNDTYGPQKIAVVKFPTNFPSPNDPFYLANSSLCNARMSYYNIIFAPTLVVDGTLRPSATDSNKVKEKIDERLTNVAPFIINVSKSFQDSSLIVNINVQAVNISGITMSDLVLYTIVTENDIEFNEAPGANGEKVFYNVLRKSLPTDGGYSFTDILAQQPITEHWEADLLSNWNPDNIHIIAFIQNIQTKEVLQAGSDL